jgi:hypothetical protein
VPRPKQAGCTVRMPIHWRLSKNRVARFADATGQIERTLLQFVPFDITKTSPRQKPSAEGGKGRQMRAGKRRQIATNSLPPFVAF